MRGSVKWRPGRVPGFSVFTQLVPVVSTKSAPGRKNIVLSQNYLRIYLEQHLTKKSIQHNLMESQHWRTKQLKETKAVFNYAAIFFFGCAITSSVFIGENAFPVTILSVITLLCVLGGERIRSHMDKIEYYSKRASTDSSCEVDLDEIVAYRLPEILLPVWVWEKNSKNYLFRQMTMPGMGVSEIGQKAVQLMIERASDADRAKMRNDSEASLLIAQEAAGKRILSKEEMEAVYLAIEIIVNIEAKDNRDQGLGENSYGDAFLSKLRIELLRLYFSG